MKIEALQEMIRSWFESSGKSEGEALALVGKAINKRIGRAKVIEPPESSICFTDFTPIRFKDESAGVQLSDADRDLIKRCGQDPDRIAALVDQDRAEKAERKRTKDAPLSLTDADRAAVKRAGIDPDEFLYCAAARDAADHARLKAGYRAARGGV